MVFVSLDIYGTERTRRTKIFTRTATDATFSVHDRNFGCIRPAGFRGHHSNSSRRAMAGAVATLDTIGERNTIGANPYGMTDLN